MKYVTVRFLNSSGTLNATEYCYMTDLDLMPDDWVIVHVREDYQCVLVKRTEGISQDLKDKAHKVIAQKVDVNLIAKEQERVTLIMEIRSELRMRREKSEEMLIYQTLAKSDPVMQELLNRLGALDGNADTKLVGNASPVPNSLENIVENSND